VFSGKTIFVVGAGASKEADLPTGEELKETIVELLTPATNGRDDIAYFGITHGGGEIFEILRRAPIIADGHDEPHQNFTKLRNAAVKIAGALPGSLSIDNYINQMAGNPYIEMCGKLAIVKAILRAERESKLFVDDSNADNQLNLSSLYHELRDQGRPTRKEETWYLKLSQFLFEDCRQEELSRRLADFSFVIFNYDRCVEHFFYWALRKSYDLTPDEAAQLVNGIAIFHPYGTVGALPWQAKRQAVVSFGQKGGYDPLLLASGIKTFTEGTDPAQSEIVQLRQAMDYANNVIFLGFGFHNQNMELITPQNGLGFSTDVTKRYFGTAAGLSNTDVEIVSSYLENMCSVNARPNDIHLRQDCYCNKLFGEYQRSFSLEVPLNWDEGI
jgi:hypothetical protein